MPSSLVTGKNPDCYPSILLDSKCFLLPYIMLASKTSFSIPYNFYFRDYDTQTKVPWEHWFLTHYCQREIFLLMRTHLLFLPRDLDL